MATLLGSLLVTLGLDSGQFKSGLSQSEKELRASQRRIQKIGDNLVGLGSKLSIAVSAPLIVLAKSAVSAAIESQAAIAQVNAALASMGDAAGKTSEQLEKLATSQMKKSLFDDDEILKSVTANLLTFGNVSGDVFDRAQQAALDLSARLGQDLQSSAIQVGKALNDPIKGLTSLGRVGVQFSAAQKEQIKTMTEAGNVAGAQGIILNELSRQFGGAAEAARKANPTAAMQQSWDEFKETLGAKLLPLLPRITDALTKILDAFGKLSPGMQTAIVVGGALAVALGPILIAVGALLPLMTALVPVIVAVGGAMLALATNPVVLGLALVIVGIYEAWKHWDQIEAIVKRLWVAVNHWIGTKLKEALYLALAPIELVRKAFLHLYDAVVGHSYIPDMVDGIRDEMARLDKVMVAPVLKATDKAAQAFKDMAAKIQPILQRLFPDRAADLQFGDERTILGNIPDPAARESAIRALADERDTTSQSNAPQIDIGGGTPFAPDMSAVDAGLEKIAASISMVKDKWGDFKEAGAAAFEEISHQLTGVILGAQSLGDALRNVVARLADMALSAAFKMLGTAIGLPAFAGGTNFAPGGLSLVGEKGPELVNLPRGSQVIPNHELKGFGGQTVHKPTFVFPGITTAKEAREAATQAARRYRRELSPMGAM